MGDKTADIKLEISNELGKIYIHVPDDWKIENKINNTAGEVNLKYNECENTRTTRVSGSNRLGEVNIK